MTEFETKAKDHAESLSENGSTILKYICAQIEDCGETSGNIAADIAVVLCGTVSELFNAIGLAGDDALTVLKYMNEIAVQSTELKKCKSGISGRGSVSPFISSNDCKCETATQKAGIKAMRNILRNKYGLSPRDSNEDFVKCIFLTSSALGLCCKDCPPKNSTPLKTINPIFVSLRGIVYGDGA